MTDKTSGCSGDSWSRFEAKAVEYAKYRLSYPEFVTDWFTEIIGSTNLPVADLGAGTGLASQALVKGGYSVFAVEPSLGMRQAGERECGSLYPKVIWNRGTAERTELPDCSVSALVFADSMQWMKLTPQLKSECQRIAGKPRIPGIIIKASFWDDPFGKQLHNLLREHPAVESKKSADHSATSIAETLFSEGKFETRTGLYDRNYSADQLFGRIVSDSHVSLLDHLPDLQSRIHNMIQAEQLSDQRITIQHRCSLVFGQLRED
tara:strand:- start:637 stop:1425 length:789 start_codon:yes stop_codon:yes gene_type:complete